jgi:hypothetical protein
MTDILLQAAWSLFLSGINIDSLSLFIKSPYPEKTVAGDLSGEKGYGYLPIELLIAPFSCSPARANGIIIGLFFKDIFNKAPRSDFLNISQADLLHCHIQLL